MVRPPAGAAAITDAQFAQLRQLIHRQFGISLTREKKALVVGRLRTVLEERGLASFQDYHDLVVADSTGKELGVLVDRISTNHTFFNRESAHFDFLVRAVLPAAREAAARGPKELRVWCAASSSGEEPYMLAMLMMEFFGREYPAWDAGLLATDISDKVLAVARRGVYDAERLADLPSHLARKYFAPAGPGRFEAIPALRKEITFRRFNLMNPVLPFRKPFDAVFCRNVMIYFDPPTKEALAGRIHAFLKPGGYLFIGHSESLGRTGPFEFVAPGIYRRPGA